MKVPGRLMLLVLLCSVGGPMTGCAVRGTSFETLGVPTPQARPGRSAVIIGWAREQREGWAIKRIRVDDTTRAEWNEDTQEPAIIYLEPGEHRLQLYTAQLSDPRDLSSRARRRYRVRPQELDLLEGMAQLCVVRLTGDERVRPQVRCEAQDIDVGADNEAADNNEDAYEDEDEYEDEYADEDEVVAPTSTTPPRPRRAPHRAESLRPSARPLLRRRHDPQPHRHLGSQRQLLPRHHSQRRRQPRRPRALLPDSRLDASPWRSVSNASSDRSRRSEGCCETSGDAPVIDERAHLDRLEGKRRPSRSW